MSGKFCYGKTNGLLCHKYGGSCRYCIKKSVKLSPKLYDGGGDTYYDYGSVYNV